VLLGIVVTLTVRQELIDRDRFVRTTGTEEWVDQTSLHAMGLLRLRVEALEHMAELVAADAAHSLDRVLDGHAVGLLDEDLQIEWSTAGSGQTLGVENWLQRPETRALAMRAAAEGGPLMTPPNRRPGAGFRALVFAPVLVEGRAPRFVVGVFDYRSAMTLDGLAGGYRLGLVIDGVPVLDAGSVGAEEAEASAHHTYAGRTLSFFATPSQERIDSSASRLPAVVLATGMAFALLLAWIQFSAQARKRSEARFRALLESAPDAGVIVDAAGRIVDVNSRAETLFGARHADLSGTSIGTLGGGTKLTKPVMDWDWNDPFELVVPRGDLPDLPLEVTASPIQTDDGLLVSMSLRDVTERTAMMDRLRESDRLKSEFVSTVSHEMRTPLTVIREFSSLVLDGVAGPVNGEQVEFLDTVVRNCDRLTGLVGDLLELAQMKSGKYRMDRQQTDLTSVLERCIKDLQALAATKDQVLLLDVQGPLPDVLCDPDRVTQVLVNLVGNANKFTPAGGAITVRAAARGTTVAVAVEDTGVGIAKEHQATIFGAFVQVGREDGPGAMGTGLGLNVARQIVEFHGGRLTVESTPGEGSTFTFTLPALDEDPLTGFLAPHLNSRDTTETPLSLLILRDTDFADEGDYLEKAYDTVVAIQRVGGDEALLAKKQKLVVIALETDRDGTLAFVRRLMSRLDGAQERLEYAIWSLDSDGQGDVPTLADLDAQEWLSSEEMAAVTG
jgi:protein-histidine pros-kinase